MDTPASIKEHIRTQALAHGFDSVGFTDAALAEGARTGLTDYLAAGHHGDMGWMEDKADRRGDPRVLWEAARSVIALGLSYAPSGDPLAALDQTDRGAISVYAMGRDYHDVVKKRLKSLARWIHGSWPCEVKVFVDTAPVMEKPLAQAAGLGWQGKHTNLVSRTHGSWLFLGEIYTDLDLGTDLAGSSHTDLCGTCRRCQDICPTGAFPAPYEIDARRCISYLTIEHKGPIDRALRPLMGNRIYGCDDCLAVCPWNKFAAATQEPDFMPRRELTVPRLVALAALSDSDFRQFFAGSPIKRVGRDRFVRNVAIAIGNSGTGSDSSGGVLAEAAGKLLDDDAPLVRGAAIWALARLVNDQAFSRIRALHLPTEKNAQVCREWELGAAI